MTENPREKIEDLKKVAGGSIPPIDTDDGQPDSNPPKVTPNTSDGSSSPGFGNVQKPDK